MVGKESCDNVVRYRNIFRLSRCLISLKIMGLLEGYICFSYLQLYWKAITTFHLLSLGTSFDIFISPHLSLV